MGLLAQPKKLKIIMGRSPVHNFFTGFNNSMGRRVRLPFFFFSSRLTYFLRFFELNLSVFTSLISLSYLSLLHFLHNQNCHIPLPHAFFLISLFTASTTNSYYVISAHIIRGKIERRNVGKLINSEKLIIITKPYPIYTWCVVVDKYT